MAQRVWTWGCNEHGECGQGVNGGHYPTPTIVAGVPEAAIYPQVVANMGFAGGSGVRLSNSTVYRWGYDFYGQVGDGSEMTGSPFVDPTPRLVVAPGGGNLLAAFIGAGSLHALAGVSTVPYGWGQNARGQIGNGVEDTLAHPTPAAMTPVLSAPASQIVGGEAWTLILKSDSEVFAVGEGVSGNLGDGLAADNALGTMVRNPADTARLSGVRHIWAAGPFDEIIGVGLHSIACNSPFTDDGRVWCWGNDEAAQCGQGATGTQFNLPKQVKGVGGSGFLLDIREVAAGGETSGAISRLGLAYLWGRFAGATGGIETAPRQIVHPASRQWVGLHCGGDFQVLVDEDGAIWTRGLNGHGQLGRGTIGGAFVDTPLKIAGLTAVGNFGGLQIGAGSHHGIVAAEATATAFKWAAVIG